MNTTIRTMMVTLTVGLASTLAVGAAQAESLTIGAAPSLRGALQAIVPMFEREYGTTVHIEYGPSQTLRRQIRDGASVDVFLPSSVQDIQKLQDSGLIVSGEPRIYAATSLVLVMSAASPAIAVSLPDALPDRTIRIALGDPMTSALGDVTDRALARLAPDYRKHARLVYASHSEDIVNLLQTGKADLGIVYRVDAITSGQIRIIDEAPIGAPIVVQFGAAVPWTCRKESLGTAMQFLEFITSPRVQKLMIHYGFDPVSPNTVTG